MEPDVTPMHSSTPPPLDDVTPMHSSTPPPLDDVTPMHSSTPPPLDDDVGVEDEEFGDFGSFSAGVSSTLSFGHFTEPPSSLNQPCPATHLPSPSFNNPVEQYQPASTVTSGIGRGQIEIKGNHCNADPPVHLTNGCPERGRPAEHSDFASVMSACSLGEETGLGFGEQAVHPWCCGFSPVGGGENWDGRAAGTNLANSSGESRCDSRQEINAASEPSSHTAKEKTKDCTKVKHCEQSDATLIQSSQDHLPQDPAAVAFQSEERHPREEEPVDPRVSQREMSFDMNPPQTNQTGEELPSEDEEESVSPSLPLTSSESVSEDFASFCDVVSPEEGFDPRLSSPAPQGDEAGDLRERTDEEEDLRERTDEEEDLREGTDEEEDLREVTDEEEDLREGTDEEEDLREGTDEEEDSGNLRHAVSITSQGFANLSLSQSEAEEGFAHFDQPEPTLQEASTDSVTSEWRTDVEEDFTDLERVSSGDQSVRDHDQRSNAADQGLPSLQPSLPPSLQPSDSFADFCSAAIEEEGKGCWEAFRDPGGLMEEKTWAPFGEEDGANNTESGAEEEWDRGQGDDSSRRDRGQGDDSSRRDRGQGDDSSRRDSVQDSLASCVQRLFQASFPIVEVQRGVGDDEEEVLSLSAVLQVPDNQPEKDQEERPEEEEVEQQLRPRAKRVQWAMWRQHQDVHNAVGLKFKWGGSHSNRTLLWCLGMDIRNIVFSGQARQPVAVPAFASSLGMLEPTKESVAGVGSPGRTRVTGAGSPGRTRVTGAGSPGRTRVSVPVPLSPRDRRGPSISSKQQTPPSRQRAWSSSGLSSSEDGSRDNAELNLDYFGPVEDTSSRSSGSNSPPPGVDRELYELTVTKLEVNITTSHLEETFNRLMSTAEKTSSSVRSAQQGEQLSQEAVKVMDKLPCLSFMQAKVLMFPSVLLPVRVRLSCTDTHTHTHTHTTTTT